MKFLLTSTTLIAHKIYASQAPHSTLKNPNNYTFLESWVYKIFIRSDDGIQLFKAACSYALLRYAVTGSKPLNSHITLVQRPHYISLHHFNFSIWAAKTNQLHWWERIKVVNPCFGILLGITLWLYTDSWHQYISSCSHYRKKKKHPNPEVCSH